MLVYWNYLLLCGSYIQYHILMILMRFCMGFFILPLMIGENQHSK